jgi:hypothetical protein
MRDLATAYQLSWSSRIRGRVRAAFTVEGDGVIFKKDFLRWLDRQYNKGEKMILRNPETRG